MDKPQTTNLMTDSSDKEKTRKLSYDGYISSVAWSNLRKEALERDGFRCRYCNEGGSEVPLDVHHRNYPKYWDEDCLDNLTTLCRNCHDIITSEIRKRRYDGKEIKIVAYVSKSVERGYRKKKSFNPTIAHKSKKTRKKEETKKEEPKSVAIIGYKSTHPDRRKNDKDNQV